MKSKIVTFKEALRIREKLRRQKKKVVFTNGCFDILHAGHAVYLDRAKRHGDFLIVGLNRDNSVRRLKGKNRPVIGFAERALLLSYLTPVDMIVGFADDTPLKLIKNLKPDILAKGADYKISEIVGADEVLENGGEVVRIPMVRGKSSSEILASLNKR